MILGHLIQSLKLLWPRIINIPTGRIVLLVLALCALIVMLGLAGIIRLDNPIEDAANALIKMETGIDLEEAGKEIINKND